MSFSLVIALIVVADIALIAGLAFDTADSAQWLGIGSSRGAAWALGPLHGDLFHGLTGIALTGYGAAPPRLPVVTGSPSL